MDRGNDSGLSSSDGRLLRGERTRRELVEAYIALLRERRALPTAAQIVERAGYSLRTLYLHYTDIAALSVAACDYAIEQGLSVPVEDKPQADRATRIRFQVEVRARNCECWAPLWRMLMAYKDDVPELDRRVAMARELVLARLELMYRKELLTLVPFERRALLMGLEAVTDYESWNRMRTQHGLSPEQACDVWVSVINRMLPPTP